MIQWPNAVFRVLRILFATSLIGVSLWALLLPPSFPYSSHAVINARAVPIRSTDRGTISFEDADRDRVLEKGARLATVSRDMEKVRRELQERKLEERKLELQISNLDEAIESHEQRIQRAGEKLREEHLAVVSNLKSSKSLTEERVRIFRASLEERSADESRVRPLFQEGIVTAAQWSEVRQNRFEAERDLSNGETKLAELVSQIEACQSGLDLRGTTQNASLLTAVDTSEKEIRDLEIKRAELQSEVEELQNQIKLADESSRTDQAYELITPIDGPVWHRHAVTGEAVVENQVVAEVVDADSLYVEAYFRRDFLSRIAIGDRASVYVVGEPRFIEGRVRDIQVQERVARANRAVNVVEMDSYMVTAMIEIERDEVALEDIGQFVKVLISSQGKTSWIERGQIWLSLMLRSHKDP